MKSGTFSALHTLWRPLHCTIPWRPLYQLYSARCPALPSANIVVSLAMLSVHIVVSLAPAHIVMSLALLILWCPLHGSYCGVPCTCSYCGVPCTAYILVSLALLILWCPLYRLAVGPTPPFLKVCSPTCTQRVTTLHSRLFFCHLWWCLGTVQGILL